MQSLVTGAAGALGGAVARALASRGDSVALVDRPEGRARIEALAAEIGKSASIHVSLDEIAGRPIDAAVLVAGGWAGGVPLHEAQDDMAYRAMMESNVDTVYFALQALLPGMVSAKARRHRRRRLAQRGE